MYSLVFIMYRTYYWLKPHPQRFFLKEIFTIYSMICVDLFWFRNNAVIMKYSWQSLRLYCHDSADSFVPSFAISLVLFCWDVVICTCCDWIGAPGLPPCRIMETFPRPTAWSELCVGMDVATTQLKLCWKQEKMWG